MRTDGHTDGHEEANSRLSDLCESNASLKQSDEKRSNIFAIKQRRSFKRTNISAPSAILLSLLLKLFCRNWCPCKTKDCQ